jgi:hypothetical protein
MNKLSNPSVPLIEDEFWDYYSGLPNPMWYQHITQDEEDTTSDSTDTIVTNG